MKAVFVALPPFSRHRSDYLDDDTFGRLQAEMMRNPNIGELIKDSGGLRKMRFADERRGKGKRGGLRIIYYWWMPGDQFWLFTSYDKDEADDLTPDQRNTLKGLIKVELEARSK